MTLADFLLARIAEDEVGARKWLGRDVRWPSRRVLAECEANRRIVGEHEHYQAHGADGCDTCRQAFPCRTLRLLALPYADHPDYDEVWRP